MLGGLTPTTDSCSFRCSPGWGGGKSGGVALLGQWSPLPSDSPQDQPLRGSHAKIHGDHRVFNRLLDVVFLQFTNGKSEKGIGHASHLIPKEGLPSDLKANQSISVHPRFGLKHGSHWVFALFETGKVSRVVGADEEVKPTAEVLFLWLYPEFHRLQPVSVRAMQGHSRVKRGFNLLNGEKGNVSVQAVVHGAYHFPRREGLPQRPVQINDAAVDPYMHAGIGSTGEHEKLFFFGSSEPLEGPKDLDQFTLNGSNIRLYLASVKGIAQVADSKEQPNLLGQETLSSFIRCEAGDGVFG